MYEKFLRERLYKLRLDNNVSAREMSLSLGQNANYINSIENGKSLPSMPVFFYICEYLKITPKEFFDIETKAPSQLNSLIDDLKKLDSKQLETLSAFVNTMINK